MTPKIVVCGLGKLGSPLAVSFAKAGVQVAGYDLDAQKVVSINKGLAPVDEPGLQEAMDALPKGMLTATLDPEKAVAEAMACIFIAPTPSLPDGSFHNQHLLDGMSKIATAHSRVHNGPFLFIVASTVSPLTCEGVFIGVIRRHSEKIQLVYKPEFIALGTVMNDLAEPDAVLVGAESVDAADRTVQLYTLIHGDAPFFVMSLVEAEIAKLSLNCAITQRISYANQVAMLAEACGGDPHKILEFVGADSRIGNKSLRPGMPFGGPCFPRDSRAFRSISEKQGILAWMADATDRQNVEALRWLAGKIPLHGTVGILGLAYKAGTSITDEAAGLKLKKMLMEKGRTVKAYDPLIPSDTLEEVLACQAIIVTTDSPKFRDLVVGPEKILVDPLNVIKRSKLTPIVKPVSVLSSPTGTASSASAQAMKSAK